MLKTINAVFHISQDAKILAEEDSQGFHTLRIAVLAAATSCVF